MTEDLLALYEASTEEDKRAIDRLMILAGALTWPVRKEVRKIRRPRIGGKT